jgi:predicted transcriptional regulator
VPGSELPRARYRSKLEVFRDLLVATRHAPKKTRIIGLANLNPSTFQKHMAIARSGGLVTVTNGEYNLTEKADRVLAALQELMAKSNELDITIQFLERNGLPPATNRWTDGAVLRQVSRAAWSEAESLSHSPGSALARSGGIGASASGSPDRKRDIEEILSALATGRRSPLPSSRSGHGLAVTDPQRVDDSRHPNLRRPRT